MIKLDLELWFRFGALCLLRYLCILLYEEELICKVKDKCRNRKCFIGKINDNEKAQGREEGRETIY
jgi:hypothetical protein